MTITAEIDLSALRANIVNIGAHAGTPVCAVVKADAYGHGAPAVARAALDAGATWLAVATAAEAVEVGRSVPGDTPILVLAERPGKELAVFGEQLPNGVRLTVCSAAGVAAAAGLARQVPVHLKVDTGMHRMGVDPDDVVTVARLVADTAGVGLEGVWTHMAVADDPDDPFTAAQLDLFDRALDELAAASLRPPLTHAANSAAALVHPRSRHDLVRVGIAMYGVAPVPGLEGVVPLSPALTLRTVVTALRMVSAGETVSYGRRWTASSPSRIATVPVGYADGLRRSSNEAGVEVLIGGRRRRIVGNVTMDQCMVLVDDTTAEGDEVVLIGAQGDEQIEVNEIAARIGTIGYEVLTSIGRRAERVHQ